ncbi:TonB-dependent receptor [Stakelama tenebrarum]|uniref:TonB-dependent receptor n=1 Tax=Stakelama tenebrarum TaxID=2711215 RepID=A0A6G6Y488_9SPHN|nr:TonB-dependent receptor [Sphingosinithalassobacter tenebrarum]QIG79386.1 TonB-dependent receptor [Sphingosinithalassobacter tenebrarum]
MTGQFRCQLLAAVGMVALAAPAQAQQAAPPEAQAAPAQGDEIVVTATRRSERLQDVPLSMQALGGDELAQMGAVNFADYARSVAGVQFQDDGPGRAQIFIRGVSSGADIDTGKESTVGVYFDETPVSEGSSQPELKLYDISRVEVLRGPQGTLYGSGSLGGTVQIITNQPEFDRIAGHGELVGSITEHGGANGSAKGWLNLPLGSDTAVRAVGYGLHNSGFLDNGLTGETDINDETTYGGRLTLRHRASSRVEFALTGMYQRSESGAYNRVTDHYPELVKDQSEPEPYTDRFGVVNLAVDADLGFAHLTSSTSYFDRKRVFENDIDYFLEALAGIPRGLSLYRYTAQSFTQEVRLASQASGPLQWLVGGYFVSRDEDYFQTINIRGAPPASAPEANLFYATTDGEVRQIAGFGEASYEPLDGLELTAGLRVSHIVRRADAVKGGLIYGGVLDRQAGRFEDTATTPKFNISYRFDEDVLVYAQASKGFRIGGTNPGLPPCPTCIVDLQSEFGPDSLWNYELGLKSQFFDRALTFNASLFWIDWDDIQLSVGREDGFTGFTNAGRARSRGFELEVDGRVSPNLQLGGQVTYTDAELRSLNPGLESYASVGVQLPQVPQWAASSFAQWTLEVGDDSRVSLRGDVQYQGERQNILGPTAVSLDDYAIVNARIGFEHGGWQLSAFVTNLTDSRAQLARDILTGVRNGNPITLDRYTVNTPRTFGISVAHDF